MASLWFAFKNKPTHGTNSLHQLGRPAQIWLHLLKVRAALQAAGHPASRSRVAGANVAWPRRVGMGQN